jgi:hypothetical protein
MKLFLDYEGGKKISVEVYIVSVIDSVNVTHNNRLFLKIIPSLILHQRNLLLCGINLNIFFFLYFSPEKPLLLRLCYDYAIKNFLRCTKKKRSGGLRTIKGTLGGKINLKDGFTLDEKFACWRGEKKKHF